MLSFSHIIPTPSFLTMPATGLDISDTSLKYISFTSSWSKKERKIKQWGDITFPNGVLERGQLNDLAQLVAVLKEFKSKTNAEFVRVSLPEERAYLFETEIKKSTPSKEVRGLLEFKLEENVPIPSRDVHFDYTILPQKNTNRSVSVAVAAYAKETIQKYYEACIEAGLYPISFEIEAQAMARAVIPGDFTGAVMLVDFGRTRTGVGIAYKGVLLYTSTIDGGGDYLSQALRKVVGQDVSEHDITIIKNTQGLIRGVNSSVVHEALLEAVTSIKDELATRMQYWHLRNGNSAERRISSIVLSGGSANLKGLPSYLTEQLMVPAVRGNVWENALSLTETIPPIDRQHSFGYATAIGLALRNVS